MPEDVEIEGAFDARTLAAVMILPEHPALPADWRRPEDAAHPERLGSKLAGEIGVMKLARDVDHRPLAVVSLDESHERCQLAPHVGDRLAGPALAHMLGIDDRRQRARLVRHRPN